MLEQVCVTDRVQHEQQRIELSKGGIYVYTCNHNGRTLSDLTCRDKLPVSKQYP